MPLPRRNRVFEQLQKDWYGSELAKYSILSKQGEPKPIADLMSAAVSRFVPKGKMYLSDIRLRWEEFAGKNNAAHSMPAFLKEGVLYVEIAHPAYRLGMDNPKVKEPIIERIRVALGENVCGSIQFIPAGRVARTPR